MQEFHKLDAHSARHESEFPFFFLCFRVRCACVPAAYAFHECFKNKNTLLNSSTHNTLNAHCCSVCDFTRISSLILDLFIFCFCRHSTQPINDDHDDDGDDADSLLPIDKKYLKLNCADEREPEKANWRIHCVRQLCVLRWILSFSSRKCHMLWMANILQYFTRDAHRSITPNWTEWHFVECQCIGTRKAHRITISITLIACMCECVCAKHDSIQFQH